MVVVMLLSVVERNYRSHRTHTHSLHCTLQRLHFWSECTLCVCVATLMCVNAVTIKIVNAVYSLMVKANIAMFFLSLSFACKQLNNSSFPSSVIQVVNVNINSYDTIFVSFIFILIYEENMNLITFIHVIFNLIILWLFPLLKISLLDEFRRKKDPAIASIVMWVCACVKKK